MREKPSNNSSDIQERTSIPIFRPSLHDAIVDRVRDMIVEGILAPGTRIHEGQLGEELGVSRTPLREALKYLASEGLVDLVPGRGAVVKKFTAKDVYDMMVVLRHLEELAGALACEHATDEKIAAVRQLHDEMIALYKSGSRREYYRLNQAIHTAIANLPGNEPLAIMHGTLQTRLKRVRFVGHEGVKKWEAAVSEHTAIISALERRDVQALTEAIRLHLSQSWERVSDIV